MSDPTVPPADPPAVPPDAPETQSVGIRQQLRLGLAMNGGIALVLYQAGVAHEVLRFTRGDNPYREALAATGVEPVLDVITGASAGGIACVMLGHCIATDSDFNDFHDVWIYDADVHGMRYPAGREPKSLLDTEQLLARVRAIFEKQAVKAQYRDSLPGRSTQPPPDLFVRLCRTDYYGSCLTTRDALGHKIDVQTQSSVAALDGADFQTWDANGLISSRLNRIVSLAQQTSAFPGAWPAVKDPFTGRWYIDGGLWNNQPLDLAVEAVKGKPAFFRTHRALLLVQPDPMQVDSPKDLPEPPVGQVLASVPLMGLNGNLWPAVQGVLNNNQRAELYDALVGSLSAPAECRSASGVNLLEQLGRADHKRARVQIDAARTLPGNGLAPEVEEPLSLLNAVRVHDLLFDNDPWLIQRWQSLLDLLGRHFPAAQRAARGAALVALHAVGEADLHQRAARRQLESVNAGLLDNAAEKDIAERKLILYTQMQAFENYLTLPFSETDGRLQDSTAFQPELRRHSRFREAAVRLLDDLDVALQGVSLASLQLPDTAPPAEKLVGRIADWAAQVQGEAARRFDEVFPRSGGEAWNKGIQVAAPRFFSFEMQRSAAPGSPAPEAAAPLSANQRRQAIHKAAKHLFPDLWPRPDDMDYVRHILAAMSDLTGRKPIDLVRVSPNDTNNVGLIGRAGAGEGGEPASKLKLAGEGLGHFQGFLEERWRRNDYVWARLDTAEILLRTLQQAANAAGGTGWSDAAHAACLKSVQADILRDEVALYNARLAPGAEKLDPASVGPGMPDGNQKLIGFGGETIADATEPRFSENMRYLLGTLITLLRSSTDRPPAALSAMERIMRVLSYVAQAVTAIMPGKYKKAWPVAGMVAGAVALGGALFGAGWLIGQKRWGDVLQYGLYGSLTASLLVALGCVLGWRWYGAVLLSAASAYTLGGLMTAGTFEFGTLPGWTFIGLWVLAGLAIVFNGVSWSRKRETRETSCGGPPASPAPPPSGSPPGTLPSADQAVVTFSAQPVESSEPAEPAESKPRGGSRYTGD